jgi:beta-glucosidase
VIWPNRLGLFDNPFVDAERADLVVGTAQARADGLAARAAAHVLLKNGPDPAHLPLTAPLRLYTEGLSAAVGARATLVDTPAEADVAVLHLDAPFEDRGGPGTIEAFFRAGSAPSRTRRSSASGPSARPSPPSSTSTSTARPSSPA